MNRCAASPPITTGTAYSSDLSSRSATGLPGSDLDLVFQIFRRNLHIAERARLARSLAPEDMTCGGTCQLTIADALARLLSQIRSSCGHRHSLAFFLPQFCSRERQ